MGLAEGAFVAGAASYTLLVEVFEEGEDVFAAGIEEGAGFGDGDAAIVPDVLGDGLDHSLIGVCAEDDGSIDFDDLVAVYKEG